MRQGPSKKRLVHRGRVAGRQESASAHLIRDYPPSREDERRQELVVERVPKRLEADGQGLKLLVHFSLQRDHVLKRRVPLS